TFHFLETLGLAAKTVDLRPPRDPGTHFVTEHVAVDELAILLIVRDRVRPRADEAHAPEQHVEQLRQLIERCLPQEAPERRDARIVAPRLRNAVVLADRHRSELVDENPLAIESIA